MGLRADRGAEDDRLIFRNLEPEPDELEDTVAVHVDWASEKMHILYATDSKTLQEVVCGHAKLRDEGYEPLLTRVLCRIVDQMGRGWLPPYINQDPVQWWRRSYNKVADGLANITMDTRRTWTKVYAHTMSIQEANVVIQTDGGLRDGDCAAAAWIIGLWGKHAGSHRYQYEPIIVHGTFIQLPCTAFGAEAIALDEASREVAALLLQLRQTAGI